MGKLALYKFAYLLSVLFTFALAAVTSLAAFASNVNPKANMFITLLGLALPVLLIANMVVFIYWVLRRKWWLLLPVLAFVANYSYISAIIQIPLFKDELKHESNTLKVMTLNARNFINDSQDDSADDIKAYIENEHIHVVCLQEYRENVSGRLERISRFFEELFPYQAISGSIATFSRYPISQKDHISFRASNNCAQWTDIELPEGKQVRIVNVHMQTTGVNRALHQAAKMEKSGIAIDKGEKARMVENRMEYEFYRRAEQADIIADILKKSPVPIVLCGDFNDPPSSYTYKKLKGKLKDGFKSAGSGYMYTYRGAKGLMRIDYIMHDECLEGISYYSDKRDWSDHNPVVMEMNTTGLP